MRVLVAASSGAPLSGPVPDVVAPPPGNPRFPLLDALRGIAAIWVLFAHVLLYSGLQGSHVPLPFRPLGVWLTVFFVLSGFLLYRPFVAAHVSGQSGPRAADYVRRRLLRIVPALWLALAVLMLYPGLGRGTDGHWWIYFGLLQNWIAAPVGLPQAWSLTVELTFYGLLLLPAFAGWWLAARVRPAHPLRAEWLVLLGVLIAWVAYELDPVTALATPTHYLDWFLGGMALAVLSVTLIERRKATWWRPFLEAHAGICWLPAAVGYLVLALNPQDLSTVKYHIVQGFVAVLLVAPAVFVGPRPATIHRVLAHPVLGWLGVVSYGIYLWHATIIEMLASTGLGGLPIAVRVIVITLIATPITIACASVSYYVLERPLLRLKHRRPPKPGITTPYALAASGESADRH